MARTKKDDGYLDPFIDTEKKSDSGSGSISGSFRLIADSDLRSSRAKCYFNQREGKFLIEVDGQKFGPFNKLQMASLSHLTADIESMSGRYTFLE